MQRLCMIHERESVQMNKAAAIILGVVLVLAVAGGSFYGGMVYGKAQQLVSPAGVLPFQGAAPGAVDGDAAGIVPGQGRSFGRGQGGTPIAGGLQMGTVKEIADGVLIMTDANGKEIRVKVTDTTLIEKNASVKVTDLEPGETLMVSGSTGSDGTVTARSIQVASPGRFGFGAPGGGPNGAPPDGAPGGAPGGVSGTTSDGQAGSNNGSSSRQ